MDTDVQNERIENLQVQPEEPEVLPKETKMTVVEEIDEIIAHLVKNDTIMFRSQQIGDADLTAEEKTKIAFDLYKKNKLNFLLKFGKYLNGQHLQHFNQFTDASKASNTQYYEIEAVLKDLSRLLSENTHHVDVKNRRYEALLQMVKDGSYFSEIEMMKRNPLLYEQLVGQFMTEDEKRERDKYKLDENVTFVKILMEGIERDNAESARKQEEEQEACQMEEEEEEDISSEEEGGNVWFVPKPCTSRWGEFEEGKTERPRPKKATPSITPQERRILKEEFITTMYQSFLDGKDKDFDYSTVDNDNSYDNIEEMEHDEEDKYFDSEDPQTITENNETASSEDELDIYMNALNQHPAVSRLANDMKRL